MVFLFKSIKSVGSDESTLTPCLPTVSLGLTVLHPEGDDKSALIDIVTVHGLSGHPQDTWTNFTTEHYWPLRSLPEDIPRSRIMSFGYSTSISPLHRSTALISDIAKQLISHLHNKRTSEDQRQRPIIFIAHSLGGIVIKELLHITSNNGHDDLANSVCGILFLGTPHRGSTTASFMDVVSGILKPLLGRPADTIIKDLASNSRHLQELDHLLRFTLNKIDIYSFYELLPMHPMKRPVVERYSALLNIPSEIEQIGLEADHRQICKPPDRNHFIYETIAQRVISVMNRQIEKAQYSSDLMEMTNKFATKQMEHILVLTKELHEGQIGPDVTMMFAIFQQTLNFHVNPTCLSGAPDTHGFEEVLKSLPIQKVKTFVDGIQRLMDRAKSLQDMLVETERQNERRKAQARIEAERRISEQQIQELMAENARLKARLGERSSAYVAPSCPPAIYPPWSQQSIQQDSETAAGTFPCLDQALQPQQHMQDMQMVTNPFEPQQPQWQLQTQLLQREQAQVFQRQQALRNQTQQQMQNLPSETGLYGRPLHPSGGAGSLDPAPLGGEVGLEQSAAIISGSTVPLKESSASGWAPPQSNWTSPSGSEQLDDESRRRKRAKTSVNRSESPIAEDNMPPPMADVSTGHGWPPVLPSENRGEASESYIYTPSGSSSIPRLYLPKGRARKRTATAAYAVPLETDVSVQPSTNKRKEPGSDPLPGPASTDPPEDHQVKMLNENRVQMVQMVGTLKDMLQIGLLVLKSGEPVLESTEL